MIVIKGIGTFLAIIGIVMILLGKYLKSMTHLTGFLFRYLIRFTFGTVILCFLEILSLIFWDGKYIEIYFEIDKLILNKNK